MSFDLNKTARLLSELRVIHDSTGPKETGKRATLRRCVQELERLGDEVYRVHIGPAKDGVWEHEKRRDLAEPAKTRTIKNVKQRESRATSKGHPARPGQRRTD